MYILNVKKACYGSQGKARFNAWQEGGQSADKSFQQGKAPVSRGKG
ncbi:MAG: hypothetical protein HFG54_09690 [Lachnospiraceae bacterium]|nr:hypothetical protein [Lachnospiraceae bacterium]